MKSTSIFPQKLLISSKKTPMSAELKDVYMISIFFGSSLSK